MKAITYTSDQAPFPPDAGAQKATYRRMARSAEPQIIEQVDGGAETRSELNRLLEDAKGQEFDTLVVTSTDRLSEAPEVRQQIIDTLTQAGVTIKTRPPELDAAFSSSLSDDLTYYEGVGDEGNEAR